MKGDTRPAQDSRCDKMRGRVYLVMCLATALSAASCDRSASIAKQKVKDEQTAAAELKQILQSKALRNAPLIAARNGLPVAQVRSVMLALHEATTDADGLPKFDWPPSNEDRLTPLLEEIAKTENMPIKTVAQIAFDDAQLKDCSDRN